MTILRDRRTEFNEAGVRTFGISRDSAWSHVAWSQVLDLGDCPLLSDWNGEAVLGFDIPQEIRGMKDVAERSAFLVDKDGIIRRAWRYETGELPDFDELLSAARSLS
ncbi:MAG TPA: redoxin domain-containing protein [Gaiellaceae bacterium]|jgi:glutaredoxin-dependent peroxiredoxin